VEIGGNGPGILGVKDGICHLDPYGLDSGAISNRCFIHKDFKPMLKKISFIFIFIFMNLHTILYSTNED
jgi:hypothetical protein